MTVRFVTLDEILLVEVDFDPSTGSGVAAPVGSIALLNGGQGIWTFRGPGATDWELVYAVETNDSMTMSESNGFINSVTIYRSSSQVTANRKASIAMAYNGNGLPLTETWSYYKNDGTTVIRTITLTYTWSGDSLVSTQQVVS